MPLVNILAVAMRKLAMLNGATVLDGLRIPPANRLEAPQGRPRRPAQHPRERFHSASAFEGKIYDVVEIVDYHQGPPFEATMRTVPT